MTYIFCAMCWMENFENFHSHIGAQKKFQRYRVEDYKNLKSISKIPLLYFLLDFYWEGCWPCPFSIQG